jgi:hypothetical protein
MEFEGLLPCSQQFATGLYPKPDASSPQLKVKVKLSLCFFLTEHHAMKAYSGSGCIAPSILWPRH